MRKWGCFGLTLGGLVGLLFAIFFWVWVRQGTTWPEIPVTLAEAPDATIFLSEASLSHFATETLKDNALVDLEPGGRMQVTTRAPWGRLRPVVHLGMTLEMQDQAVISRLHWARLGFLTIPAGWLPRNIREMAALPGETITQQVPPGFHLYGLNTTADGLEFYLNWVGP